MSDNELNSERFKQFLEQQRQLNEKTASKKLLSRQEQERLEAQRRKEAELRVKRQKELVREAEERRKALDDAVKERKQLPKTESQMEKNNREIVEREQKRIAHEQHKFMDVKSAHDRIIGKLEMEVAKEKDRSHRAVALRNSWGRARDSAVSIFGDNADLDSIDKSFQKEADKLNPRVRDVSDIVSMEINNALYGDENVQVIMTDGSIRTMDSEVASYLSKLARDSGKKDSFVSPGTEKDVSDESVMDDVAKVSSDDELTQTFSDPSLQAQFEEMQNDEIEKARELETMLSQNQKKIAELQRDLYASTAPEKSREIDLKSRQLPTVAYEYDYLFKMNSQHNGRDLPTAMSSETMRKEMQESGRSFGLGG